VPPRQPLSLASVLVLAGIAACAATALFVAEPSGRLPGVALGSELILGVERALVLFATWMLVVTVVARALRGELPTEISGRGVRYAEADDTGLTVARLSRAVDDVLAEIDALRDTFAERQ
jgi:hypothetical protein